jgi:pimeloyl-ACP methyl ester carboxylesterase
MEKKIQFKKGSYLLNKEENFNFQLNRVIMWDGGRLEDIQPIADNITDSESWKQELISLGDKATEKGRIENAIAYYRMSEFFMYDGDKDKLKYYRLGTKMFYEYFSEYFESGKVKKLQVPYEDVSLPVMYTKAVGQKKDTILLHGGNDSYFEEFFYPMLYFAENGFDVYLFEGPGQGGVVREQGKHFTYQWEKPVKAVLDTFQLEDITIIGASLGGMLAPRAAAFDKRIQRVIGWSIFPNFLSAVLYALPKSVWVIMKWMIKNNFSGIINSKMKKMMAEDQTVDWAIRHGMYAYEANSPFEYLKKLNDFQMVNIGDRITQDMLIIGANQDHFIAKELYKEEIDALTNVRSLTYRLFTEKECAEGHCNVGNPQLCFNTMVNWIEQMKREDR